jgi:calcium-dependent protein kinase
MGICIKSNAFTEFKLETRNLHTEHSFSSDSQFMQNSQCLSDVYALKEVIGQGSFGTVRVGYRIDNPEKKVAIKSIPKPMIMGSLSSIKTEFRILSLTSHPNIVQVYDSFEDISFFHIVLEYCDGGELLKKISSGKLSEKQSCRYMNQMLSAVSHLHEKNICHRDIKPANFLFENHSEDAQLKLIDFGLSRQYKRNNMTTVRMTSFVGTPLYIAPEVINGNYAEKCDLWGLGVILFFMIAGHLPFDAPKVSEVYKKVLSEKVDFGYTNISKEAQDLILRLLHKDPKKRFSAKQALQHPWFNLLGIEDIHRIF